MCVLQKFVCLYTGIAAPWHKAGLNDANLLDWRPDVNVDQKLQVVGLKPKGVYIQQILWLHKGILTVQCHKDQCLVESCA